MADKYQMASHGSEFVVTENAGGTVGVYKTEKEAQQGIRDCQGDNLMLETARSLLAQAIDAHMRMHDIDRQVAHDWIREAADWHFSAVCPNNSQLDRSSLPDAT